MNFTQQRGSRQQRQRRGSLLPRGQGWSQVTTILQKGFPPGCLLSCTGQEGEDDALEGWCSHRLGRFLHVFLQMMISIHRKWYNNLFAY